jgi:hypothetical protein
MTRLLQFVDGGSAGKKKAAPGEAPPFSCEMKSGLAGVVAIALGSPRSATTAAHGRFLLVVGRNARRMAVVVAADGGREHREIDPLVTVAGLAAAVGPIAARGPLGAIALGALRAVVAIIADARLLALLRLLVTIGLAVAIGLGVIVHLIVLAIVVAIIVAALALLLVEPHPALAENAEIMIGELQIIFGLDAVPRELRIARHALVFFKQLGGIAALPVIAGIIAAVPGHPLGTLSTAAATAAALTVVNQAKFPRRTGVKSAP